MIKNIFSYATFQLVNFILPLLTFPFFLRILDAEQIGVLAVSTALNGYFLIFTEFGFSTTATKDVAINKNKHQYIQIVYSSVFYIKIIVLCILFIALCLFLSFFQVKYSSFYLLNFLSVIGISLYPLWFLQGIEKIKLFTGYNILIRITFVILILIFVNSRNEFLLIPIFNGIGFIFSSLLGMFFIYKKLKIKITLVNYEKIKDRIAKSLKIFYTRILVSIYNSSNILLLGFLTSDLVVAKYYVIDKVIFIAGAFFEPINQVIFPRLANLYIESSKMFYKIVNSYFLLSVGYILATVSILFFFSDWIILILTGKQNSELVNLLHKSTLVLVLIPFGPFLSNILIIKGKEHHFLNIIKLTVAIDLLMVPVSIVYFKLEGLFFSYSIVLLIHVLLLYFVHKKYKLEYSR